MVDWPRWKSTRIFGHNSSNMYLRPFWILWISKLLSQLLIGKLIYWRHYYDLFLCLEKKQTFQSNLLFDICRKVAAVQCGYHLNIVAGVMIFSFFCNGHFANFLIFQLVFVVGVWKILDKVFSCDELRILDGILPPFWRHKHLDDEYKREINLRSINYVQLLMTFFYFCRAFIVQNRSKSLCPVAMLWQSHLMRTKLTSPTL